MNDLSIYTPSYYRRDQAEYWFEKYNLLRPDQLAALCYALQWPFWGREWAGSGPRNPGEIISVGCGTGFLERVLERMGYRVIGVDPSPGAKALYRGKILRGECPVAIDTIIFCESIEHIPLDTIDKVLSSARNGCRVIITNWPDYHPIPPTGDGDHITLVDDNFFDRITKGHNVLLRKQSHLVFEVQKWTSL